MQKKSCNDMCAYAEAGQKKKRKFYMLSYKLKMLGKNSCFVAAVVACGDEKKNKDAKADRIAYATRIRCQGRRNELEEGKMSANNFECFIQC